MKRNSIIALALLLSGCIRYTPSYKEIEERTKSSSDQEQTIGGEQEFELYEADLQNRLDNFLKQRAHLVAYTGAPKAGYPVGAGDVLGIDVFGFSNLTTQIPVASDGSITAPLIGKTQIGEMSLEEARAHISRQYGRFIRAPQVQVSLKSTQASRVSIMGEVTKPGFYPITHQGMLLTELLSEAGGRSQNAGSRIILLPAPRIVPEHAPQQSTSAKSGPPEVVLASGSTLPRSQPNLNETPGVEIELEALTGQLDRRPLLVPLMPGDTVVVPEAGTYEVDGEVTAPGSYKLASRTSVIGAIAAAQGFTYSANVNQVEVLRDTGGGRKAILTLDMEEVGLRGGRDIRLRNGDLVRVPSEPNRFFKRQIVETVNGLFNGFGAQKRIN
jgi:polysaccharide export outer membrane protein